MYSLPGETTAPTGPRIPKHKEQQQRRTHIYLPGIPATLFEKEIIKSFGREPLHRHTDILTLQIFCVRIKTLDGWLHLVR
jgi:hypothetical protein